MYISIISHLPSFSVIKIKKSGTCEVSLLLRLSGPCEWQQRKQRRGDWEHDNTGLLSRHQHQHPTPRYVAIHRRIRTSIWFRLQIEFGTITRSSPDKRPQNDWNIYYKLSKKDTFYFIRHCQIWNVNDSLIVPSAPSLCLTCGGESSVAKEWPSEEHYLTRLPFPCIIIQHDSMTRLSH